MPSERLRFRDIRNTSTFRLALLLGLVAVVGVTMLAALIYTLSARELNARNDHILHAETTRLARLPPASLPTVIGVALERNPDNLIHYGLLGPDGRHIAGNLRGSSGVILDRPREIAARAHRHGPIRLLAVRLRSGEILLVGRDITPLVDLRWRVLTVLATSGLVIALLVAVAAVALSLGPLRRIGVLQRTAQQIAAGHLEERMPLQGRGDELDQFAGTVNMMVEEVGRVIGQVKSVTDAIAHDLRTPLTRVRSQLDRARRQEGLEPALGERIGDAITDLDTVLDRFTALLRIAEIEAGSRRAGFARVALDTLLGSVIELYQPLAEERAIVIDARLLPAATVHGDRSLLFEALSNLLDNAIKFAPEGGRIVVATTSGEQGPRIEIADNGPGIPPDMRKSVLRRFDRGDAPAGIPGSGLGLSVVAAIVHLHQFTLSLADGGPGLIVRIDANGPHQSDDPK